MSTTGSSGFVDGMLINLLLIIFGVIAVVWFSTLTTDDRQIFIDHGLRITTFVLAQPGIFLTVKIVANEDLNWQKRCSLGAIIFLSIGLALPIFAERKLEQSVPALLHNFERTISSVPGKG